MARTSRFNAAEYLNTGKKQAAYLTVALGTGDADFVRDALGLVARARGMTRIAASAKVSRESLYKALGAKGNPEFDTVKRVIHALGLRLSAHPVPPKRASRKRRAA